MIRQFSISLFHNQAEELALAILDGVDIARETGEEVSIVKMPTTFIASTEITQEDAMEYVIPLYIEADSPQGDENGEDWDDKNIVSFTDKTKNA